MTTCFFDQRWVPQTYNPFIVAFCMVFMPTESLIGTKATASQMRTALSIETTTLHQARLRCGLAMCKWGMTYVCTATLQLED